MTCPLPQAAVGPVPQRALTVEEYLRFEETAPVKHEYVAGVVYAMSGARIRHHRIVSNIHGRIWNALRGGTCEVYRDSLKLRAGDAIYYPDVMVVCQPQDEHAYVVDDACLVVEVTSPSTAATDWREKPVNYKHVPSLRAYLIVDHRRRRVEAHWRDDAGEWRHAATTEGPIVLPCVDLTLTLDEVYEGVTVVAVSEPPAPPYAAEWYTEEEYEADEALEP
jgi:Uma2 family endonuclease